MGISRGSFFYHFKKNREGFITELMERWKYETAEIISKLDMNLSFEESYDLVTDNISVFFP